MKWYEAEVRELEQRRVPEGQVVFYGSSSIRLWTSLERDLSEFQPVNRGFGGSTLAACAHFFVRLVVPLRPRAIVLYAGDNDLGDGQSVSAVVRSLRSVMDQRDALVGAAVPVLFMSVKPSPARWQLLDRIRLFNEQAQAEIAARCAAHWVDVFGPMLETRKDPPSSGRWAIAGRLRAIVEPRLASERPRRELFADDGLHLSAEGYGLWAAILREQLAAILPDPMPRSDT